MSEIIREALERARHALVTLEGLLAADGLNAYYDAQRDGADASGAFDCLRDEMWRIDNKDVIAAIDEALQEVGA